MRTGHFLPSALVAVLTAVVVACSPAAMPEMEVEEVDVSRSEAWSGINEEGGQSFTGEEVFVFDSFFEGAEPGGTDAESPEYDLLLTLEEGDRLMKMAEQEDGKLVFWFIGHERDVYLGGEEDSRRVLELIENV